ncbi:hypothetical protein NDU88_010880 [Pleurodeles waltl]|uniref:Immunoglobulin domain-containing protein n=1 Tax=Pleurodeles waltl TaxID=8319 RepID=A0AAV7PZN9_PLEWA|nr:hypothetical protein NDU88_010880 [Pleurodeles waltl]
MISTDQCVYLDCLLLCPSSSRSPSPSVPATSSYRYKALTAALVSAGVLRAQEDRDKYFNVTLPSTVTAQEGLCVLIPCTFTYEETAEAAETPRGYWFFEGDRIQEKAVATNDVNKEIHEHTRGRFRLVGDVRSRDCSLSINDVRRSDAGSYIFKYEHNERSTTKYSYIRYPLCVTVTGESRLTFALVL